jgi:hypothetical protein
MALLAQRSWSAHSVLGITSKSKESAFFKNGKVDAEYFPITPLG